jgi:hypothetical protein
MVKYQIEVVNFLFRRATYRKLTAYYALASKLKKPALRRQAQGAGFFFACFNSTSPTATHSRLPVFSSKKTRPTLSKL